MTSARAITTDRGNHTCDYCNTVYDMQCAAQVSDACPDETNNDVASTCSILPAIATAGCTFVTCCDTNDKCVSTRGGYRQFTHADARGDATTSDV